MQVDLILKLVSAVPEPIILPVIFKDDNNVDALETNKLVQLVLLNIDVDVAFKLLIDIIEFVDNEKPTQLITMKKLKPKKKLQSKF